MKTFVRICIGMNLLFLAIDPILAGIFLLLWPYYAKQHKLSLNDEV